MKNELKPFWTKLFSFNWKFGLFLILLICIPRFFLVLHANKTSNYSSIGLIMTISAIAPFLFLSKHGRKTIGIQRPQNISWLFLGLFFGVISSILIFYLGTLLYGNSIENWYVYIGKSYNIPGGISPHNKFIMFVIMAGTGMIFSPIGEELFFRGIVHSSFAKSVGEFKASIIDSAAFAFTHISHFGLIYTTNKWEFLTFPSAIWVICMFLVSVLFYQCRKKSGSLLGAILCHATFNLGMIYCIFYLLN